MGDRYGMDLDRRGCEGEPGGAAGGETVMMYIMQEKNSIKGERKREREVATPSPQEPSQKRGRKTVSTRGRE